MFKHRCWLQFPPHSAAAAAAADVLIEVIISVDAHFLRLRGQNVSVCVSRLM